MLHKHTKSTKDEAHLPLTGGATEQKYDMSEPVKHVRKNSGSISMQKMNNRNRKKRIKMIPPQMKILNHQHVFLLIYH